MSAATIPNAILRKPAVLALCGFGTTTLYDRIKGGLFTAPIRIGARLSGWRASEVDAINGAISAGFSDDEIRILVRNLLEARKNSACATVRGRAVYADVNDESQPKKLGASLGASAQAA